MAFGMKVGLGPVLIVLDGDTAPLPKKGAEPPQFSAQFLLRPNGRMDQDATWFRGRPWPRRHCVKGGPISALPKKAAEPPFQFSALVYCGQTTGWIKTPLGTEVDLGPGHFVLDGFPAIGERGTCILWPRSPISATTELL